MLTFGPNVRIYVAVEPVDMRKSHDGLAAIMQEKLALDPLSGHLVLFVNRRRDMLKVQWFDRTGHVIVFPAPPTVRADSYKEPELSLLRPPSPRTPSRRHAWWPWAELLEEEVGVNGLRCPRCGGILHLRAVVVGPPATTKILASMARSARGPP